MYSLRTFRALLLVLALAGIAAIIASQFGAHAPYRITEMAGETNKRSLLAQQLTPPSDFQGTSEFKETRPGCTGKGYCLAIPLPTKKGLVREITGPAQYIKTIYQFGLAIGGLLAMAVIVFGAIKYTASAGNPSAQDDAKKWITNAIYGLVLLFAAVLILITIDPGLVLLREPKLSQKLQKVGFPVGVVGFESSAELFTAIQNLGEEGKRLNKEIEELDKQLEEAEAQGADPQIIAQIDAEKKQNIHKEAVNRLKQQARAVEAARNEAEKIAAELGGTYAELKRFADEGGRRADVIWDEFLAWDRTYEQSVRGLLEREAEAERALQEAEEAQRKLQ